MTINPPNLYPAYLITHFLELVQFQNYEKTEGGVYSNRGGNDTWENGV